MTATHARWMKTASGKLNIATRVAVNTEEQRRQLLFLDVEVCGEARPGPVWSTHILAKNVSGKSGDIVILVSDDFFPPEPWDDGTNLWHWDTWLASVAEAQGDCGILVADGLQPGPPIPVPMTIPIMTYGCLLRLNRIIYHPDYHWQFSDAELMWNLGELGLLLDKRTTGPVFEHKHWLVGKRVNDAHDSVGLNKESADRITYGKRMAMSLADRLQAPTLTVGDIATVTGTEPVATADSQKVRLSILICSLGNRSALLGRLMERIESQRTSELEVLVDVDDGQKSIGSKRNALLQRATGDYVAFVDDDDLVSANYVKKILEAVNNNPDCCGMEGIYTVQGTNPRKFIHSIQYTSWFEQNGILYRNPNHLSPVRREHALATMFPEINHGEDRVYSERLLSRLKTETYIEGPIYHYLCMHW